MSERSDAMIQPDGLFMGVARVLQALTGTFLPGQVILFPMLFFRGSMGVRRHVVEFRRALVIFVMRSVVITCGHKLKRHDLAGLCVSVLGKLVSTIRVLKRTFGMPVFRRVIPLFIVLCGGTVELCRQFVCLCGFSV